MANDFILEDVYYTPDMSIYMYYVQKELLFNIYLTFKTFNGTAVR